MSEHIAELEKRFDSLAQCRQQIIEAFEVIATCYRAGGKLLLAGNGGSAADAEHISGELLKGFCRTRPLVSQWRDKLPADLADKLQGALPAIPLTSFISASTAFCNDVDATYGFAQLTWALGLPADVLVGISTSGSARNVCLAADVARAKDMPVVALTGAAGGPLGEKANVTIRVPETETRLVQELHMPVYHCLCLMLEDEFFGES